MRYTSFTIIVFYFFCAQTYATDSLSVIFRIPVKEYAYGFIDNRNDSIGVSSSRSDSLITAKTKKALDYAPTWLSIPLEDRFSTLDPILQDTLAQILLATKDPYVDEMAFTIAHMPQEVLGHKDFYLSLLTENVEAIYHADSGLEYVAIVDSGSAKSGGDYFSTTQYTVIEDDNKFIYTLPRDIYYWYIVHPKLQGELPTYITPDSPNPVAPPKGKFWRTYLWSHQEPGYNALCDTLKGISFLWANKINNPSENGALGRLSQWCNLILPWGDHPQYRWPQPVYLYHQHCGTCSEHGWFASAAARTALIPVTLTKAARFDHKWNEFFYRRWIDWEPINGWIARINEPNHADDYWSDKSKPPLTGCFNWRGDGFIWGTTEHYSSVCTLAVMVTDSNNCPIDGAKITIDTEGEPGNFLVSGWTGSDGFCQFLLGDRIPFFTAEIQSTLGNVAAVKVINSSEGGKRYQWSPIVPKNCEKMNVQQKEGVLTNNESSKRISCRIDARREIIYGKHDYSLFGYSFPCTFSDERSTGNSNFYICDETNFLKFKNNESFSPEYYRKNLITFDTIITIPESGERYYFILSGKEKENATSIIYFSLAKQGNSSIHYPNNKHLLPKTTEISIDADSKLIRVAYSLSKGTHTVLSLYNLSGKPLLNFYNGYISKGISLHTHSLPPLPAGIYYLSARSDEFSHQEKIIIVKK